MERPKVLTLLVDVVLMNKANGLYYNTFKEDPLRVTVNSLYSQWERQPTISSDALGSIQRAINSNAFKARVFFHEGIHVVQWRPNEDETLLIFASPHCRQEQAYDFFRRHSDPLEFIQRLFHKAEGDKYTGQNLKLPLLPVELQFPPTRVLKYLQEQFNAMGVSMEADGGAWNDMVTIFENIQKPLRFDEGGLPLEWMGPWYWLKSAEQYYDSASHWAGRMTNEERQRVEKHFQRFLENERLKSLAPKGMLHYLNMREAAPWEVDALVEEEEEEDMCVRMCTERSLSVTSPRLSNY